MAKSSKEATDAMAGSPGIWFLKLIYRLVVPGGLLVGLAVVLLKLHIFEDKASDTFFPYYPFIIFAGGLLLSAIFNRTRLFFAMLVLMLAESTLLWVAPGLTSGEIRQNVFNCVSLLLPLNLMVFGFFRDRGIISQAGRRRLTLIALQVVVVYIVSVPLRYRAGFLNHPIVRGEYAQLLSWSRLSQPALLAFVIAVSGLVCRLIKTYRPVESSLMWTTVAMFIAMQMGPGNNMSVILFAMAGVILIVAIVETSYSMAYLDELTQLPSRRSLNEALLKLGDSYTIAMIDVDHFKRFNDTYGHEAGDHALRMVASKLARVAGGGKAYRYGGEEFAVLFPGRPLEEAFTYLDRMRRLIEQSTFVVRGADRRTGKPGRARRQTSVTVSIGVACNGGDRISPDQVLQSADQALYRAKAKGRNCTMIAREGKPANATGSGMRILSVS